MRDEDAPPEDIWLDQEALGEHFARLKDRYSSSSGMEPIEQVELNQNELTKGMKGAR